MTLPHSENVENRNFAQFLVFHTSRNQPRATTRLSHSSPKVQAPPPECPPLSINVLPPSFSQPPPLLQSNLYTLPPTDLSYHLDVKNPQIPLIFEVGHRQQIVAIEATIGTTSNTVSMYFENLVTSFSTLSSSYVNASLTTLGAIVQSDHLIGSSEHFVSYTPCAGNKKIRIVDGSLAPIVFGCTVYVHSNGPNQNKFTPKAQACMFVGYLLHQRGYKCFHPSSRKYFITMDVTFIEDRLSLPLSLLQGKSVAEESNYMLPLESTCPTVCTEWKNVFMEEMKALEKNNTWKICALSKGYMSVGCKWVFTLKYKTDGTLDRHKTSHLEHGLADSLPLSSLKEVARSKERISVSQRKYTLDLLTKKSMLRCHSTDTLIEFNCKLGNSDDQVLVDKEQYQRLVGKLICLSHTHPDISFAMSVVSQFMCSLSETHGSYQKNS
ncbi:reverse transcriptase [Cucumis melo var. makuwa]|uniref:Reverse transcriptase n=1 Tax=Cucumis melo var. makuwa TaxID=1194695 RepID=A0A5D3BRY6_CUCMM|nr:reverse transcriptase [Cucumis melo var. makuwa]TYK01552.1 reverse transcriptase [Cucumis melo var. makuwa]